MKDTLTTVPHSRKRKPSERLLGLEELTKVVYPQSSYYRGMKDVPVDRIIGSENRSAYFGEDFLPLFRWMDKRWLKVREMLLSGELTEPLQLFEYGGYYFVRDGNHRVSVAKAEGVEFLTAEVTRLVIPIGLCPGMNRRKIPVFKEKHRFQEETKLFDTLPEEVFDVRLPETWNKLKVHIFVGHRNWMIRRDGREPENEQLYLDWNIELYENMIAEIRRNQLSDLYPGYGATDIFCEIMDYWRDHPGWLSEVYDALILQRQRKDILTFVKYRFGHFLQKLKQSAFQEKDRFLRVSKLMLFRPDAEVPHGNKNWYRFLTRQLFGYYYYRFKAKHGRYPEMNELTGSWYDKWFFPVLKYYKEKGLKKPFPGFYKRWSKRWYWMAKRQESPGFSPEAQKST